MKVQFTYLKAEEKPKSISKKVIKEIEALLPGTYRVVIEKVDDNVVAAKKKYFAMVDELGLELGYMHRLDRELWKEQVKALLGEESLAEMTDLLRVAVKIEELVVFAMEHCNYTFKPYDNDERTDETGKVCP